MGIIFPGEDFPDAFFSYAHDDNDLYDDYVSDFKESLLKKYRAQTRIALGKDYARGEQTPLFFVDKEGLPPFGLIDPTLKFKVQKSIFLFIFVGQAYLLSEYCGKELRWFIEAYGEAARERTVILVLDSRAYKGLNDILAASNRNPNVDDDVELLKEFSNNRQIKCYGEDGKPARIVVRDNEFRTHPYLTNIAGVISESLTNITVAILRNQATSTSGQGFPSPPMVGIDPILEGPLSQSLIDRLDELWDKYFKGRFSNKPIFEQVETIDKFFEPSVTGALLACYGKKPRKTVKAQTDKLSRKKVCGIAVIKPEQPWPSSRYVSLRCERLDDKLRVEEADVKVFLEKLVERDTR